MPPPGKVSLATMQLAALEEAERIEISEEAGKAGGRAYDAGQLARRDAMHGIVRLIDTINSSAELLRLLKQRNDQIGAAVAAARAPAEAEDVEIAAE
jgi:hypothetical protein